MAEKNIHHLAGDTGQVHVTNNVVDPPTQPPPVPSTPLHPSGPTSPGEHLREVRHQVNMALAHLGDADVTDPAILADITALSAAAADIVDRTAPIAQAARDAEHAANMDRYHAALAAQTGGN